MKLHIPQIIPVLFSAPSWFPVHLSWSQVTWIVTIIPEVNSFVPVQWLSPNPQFPIWLTQVKTCHWGSDFSQADLCNEYNSQYVSTVLSAPSRQETGLKICNKNILLLSSYQPTLEFECLWIGENTNCIFASELFKGCSSGSQANLWCFCKLPCGSWPATVGCVSCKCDVMQHRGWICAAEAVGCCGWGLEVISIKLLTLISSRLRYPDLVLTCVQASVTAIVCLDNHEGRE